MAPPRSLILLSLAAVTTTQPFELNAQDGTASRTDGLVEAIVHASLQPAAFDIYIFDDPDSEGRPLTSDPAHDYNAVFSPDGRWVVFTSERLGNADLWVLDLESEGPPRQLTWNTALDDAATFSPDGRTLAFVSTREGNADIFTMPFRPDDPSVEASPTNLTRRPGGDFNPAFSPDGSTIAYSRQRALWMTDRTRSDAHGVDLYVMRADGSEPRPLVTAGPPIDLQGVAGGSVAGSPAWSPDGAWLYYYRLDGDGLGVRRIRPDGADDSEVTSDGLSPAVGVDGRIVFPRPRRDPGLDAFDQLRTGRLASIATDGSDLRSVGDTIRDYYAPDVDVASGRIIAHGRGATGDVPTIRPGVTFAPPGSRRRVQLPDRVLEVIGVRGYFPAIAPDGYVLSTVFGGPPPWSLVRSAVDGSDMTDVYAPESGVAAWGAMVADDAGLIVVADGPPFAPGDVEVDIVRLRLDGSGAENLTADVQANDALPDVSNDGRTVVFRSGGGGAGQVYAIVDGERRPLTDDTRWETMPAISPDGEWIVFPTNSGGGMKLWIQRIDGTGGRWLEPDRLEIPDVSMHPRFSPEGEWIVFTSNRGGFNDEWTLWPIPQPYGDLWAIPATGGDAIRLFHNKWEDGPGDWGYIRTP